MCSSDLHGQGGLQGFGVRHVTGLTVPVYFPERQPGFLFSQFPQVQGRAVRVRDILAHAFFLGTLSRKEYCESGHYILLMH